MSDQITTFRYPMSEGDRRRIETAIYKNGSVDLILERRREITNENSIDRQLARSLHTRERNRKIQVKKGAIEL